ncbi:MAG: hypothetical protein K8H90_08060, partial [Thermoanaerobaculia bacterium]|nr:hypothetical protein [Thermoanaerobaculia bacterium]
MFDIRSRATAALACAGFAFAAPLTAAPPVATMVADIAQVVPTSTPPEVVANRQPRSLPARLGGFTYFFGDDGIHGRELWRSDGTPGGTSMVRDLCPGRCGAAALYSYFAIATAGSHLFFAADDGVHGQELWALDAGSEVPRLVADLVPGVSGSSPGSFQPVGERLFFLARDPIEGSDLWVTDGTGPGTHRVADLTPGPDSFYYAASADLGGVLLFGAHWPVGGLWRSDGTAEGTYQISSVQPWQYSWLQGAPFLAFGDRLVFSGQAQGAGEATLWISDGTSSGTVELAPLRWSWNFAACGDALYFNALDSAEPGSAPKLYRTQGTPESTVAVALPDGVRPPGMYGRQACAASRLLFAGFDDAHGTELWVASESGAELLV